MTMGQDLNGQGRALMGQGKQYLDRARQVKIHFLEWGRVEMGKEL